MTPTVPAHDDERVALPDDAVEVARVLGAWGVKGGIKLKPFAADPQALFSSKRWFLAAPEAASVAPPGTKTAPPRWPQLLRVSSARMQGDAVVATVHDITDRDAAQALAKARVFISRASFPTPAADEFYWVDLIGLSVRNRAGRTLGTVDHLIETGPHCVLAIHAAPAAEGEPPVETLIPFVAAYVDRVDREARLIEVDWSFDDAV